MADVSLLNCGLLIEELERDLGAHLRRSRGRWMWIAGRSPGAMGSRESRGDGGINWVSGDLEELSLAQWAAGRVGGTVGGGPAAVEALILAAATGRRRLSRRELQEVLEHVAQAGFDPRPDRRGRTAAEKHCRKHVVALREASLKLAHR